MANEVEYLTKDEMEAMDISVALVGKLRTIVASDRGETQDLAELITPIHHIQRAIMAQAACRAYPDKYRLLGASGVEVKDGS